MLKFSKIFLFSLILISFLPFFAPQKTLALDNSTPTWTIPTPKITIPGLKTFSTPVECTSSDGKKAYCIPWIGEYLAAIYKYAIGIVGIVAAIMLMVGGIFWLTAGGNATQVSNAQGYITASLSGLVLALLSYTLLYTINPDLVTFKPIKVKNVTYVSLGGSGTCNWFDKCDSANGLIEGSGCSGTGETVNTGTEIGSVSTQVCCCYTTATSGCSWKDSCGSTETDTDGACGTYWGGSQRCCCVKGYVAPSGAKLSDFNNITSTAQNTNKDINNLGSGIVGVLHDIDNAGLKANISTMITGHSYYVDGTGDVSLHAKGQAVDISCSSASQCSEIAQWLVDYDKSKITQLIYYPSGVTGYGVLNGSDHTYNAKTQTGHATHIHLAVKG